ncbi:2Fe-2S iron-sulfur cluster-binding protein [Actinomadura scrupuli]|uniref:2Fe-2S iron-sulfur cluster-binding protein n=1 Tax=Actinomadura scrupuli TaxID=559629 RepID=UPI003D96751C
MVGRFDEFFRDRGLYSLRVAEVVGETADASSFILSVPDGLSEKYAYRAGQFLTFRVELDGVAHLRSYSMSSSPLVDERMRVTVKRVAGGVVSNWMNDALAPGDELVATVPSGTFVADGGAGDIVAFAAGSGITPVLSIIKTALAGSARRVRLLYANRDRDSVIFGTELADLKERYEDRIALAFHYDCDSGYLEQEAVRAFLGTGGDAVFFVCGPNPFMDHVQGVLTGAGIHESRVHIERFTHASDAGADQEPGGGTPQVSVSIRLGRQTVRGEPRPGSTILQAARALGLKPPSSCESGSCATCMARVVEGTAVMRNNEALTPEEVDDGWVLTCQAVPTSPSVRVVYA